MSKRASGRDSIFVKCFMVKGSSGFINMEDEEEEQAHGFGHSTAPSAVSLAGDHHQLDESIHVSEIREFYQALKSLKDAFVSNPEFQDTKVNEKLKEVNSLLRQSLTRHQSLYAKDILEMATLVNSKIKVYYASTDAEAKPGISTIILYAVEHLFLAFQKSLSDNVSEDCLFGQTEPFENVGLENSLQVLESATSDSVDGNDLVLLRVDSGIDKALQHAIAWLDSAKFIMNYIEKRISIDIDFSKHLLKLSHASQNSIRNEKTIPLQSAYTSAFAQDVAFAERIQQSCNLIQSMKFMQPLTERCLEHKKICKDIRDCWTREERLMRETTENLRRSKANYITKCRELMKMKQATQRALAETAVTNDGVLAIRVEKRRKSEEESVIKAMEAQTNYERSIHNANRRYIQLITKKKKVLFDIRQLIEESDKVLKAATIDYFTLMNSRMTPVPSQFQALKKSSEQYEPGSIYDLYIEQLSSATGSSAPEEQEPFVFEPFIPTAYDQYRGFGYMQRLNEFRKRIGPSHELLSSELVPNNESNRSLKESSAESHSSRSLDSSPVRCRSRQGHRKLTNSSSFDILTDTTDDKDFIKVSDKELNDVKVAQELPLSNLAKTHDFKKLRTPSKCRQCDTYIYFNGFECVLCGLSCHKICLHSLRWECGHQRKRSSLLGSSGNQPSPCQEKHLPDRVPYVIKKCIEEIDRNGIDTKGIYRVSAVKSKVVSLSQKLDSEEVMLDFSGESPHTVASLLRQYLRQLNEPLLPFETCKELVECIKDFDNGMEESDLVQQMKLILNRLPGGNLWTCSFLVHHLKRVSELEEQNLMSATNLSVVFGPTLIRMGDDSVICLADAQYQCRVVKQLITNAQEIFGADPLTQPGQDLTVPSVASLPSDDAVISESAPSDDRLNASSETTDATDDTDHIQPGTTIWFDQHSDCEVENLNFQPSLPSDKGFLKVDNREQRSVRDIVALLSSAHSFSPSEDVSVEDDHKADDVSGRSFQRMRAYSPQFHRRYIPGAASLKQETFGSRKPVSLESENLPGDNCKSAIVRRKSFNVRKPYSADSVVTQSGSDAKQRSFRTSKVRNVESSGSELTSARDE